MTSEQRPPVEHIERQASVDVAVRRSPRYGRFLILGAIVGVVVALILTVLGQPSEAELAEQTFTYSFSSVFGFAALICGSIGVLLAGIIALLLDRLVGKRLRPYTAEHELVAYDEPEDDAPGAESVGPATT